MKGDRVFGENGEYIWRFEEGMRSDLEAEDYHKIRAISKSGLDLVNKSPAHYEASWGENGKKAVKEETPAMIFGRLVHLAVLEPDKYAKDVIQMPKFTGKGSVAARAAWIEANPGECVDAETDQTIKELQDAVLSHKVASRLLTGGAAETSMFWRYDFCQGGPRIECKGRPDYLLPNGVIVDLKTTSDARPHEFSKSSASWRYHVQAAYYLDGLRCLGTDSARDFVFVAVEKTPPYAIGIYRASEEFLAKGRLQYELDLQLYARCLAANEWPGYSESILTLDLPKWHNS